MSVITNERTKAAIDDWMAAKDGRESRYYELFGTPERAARTMASICESCQYGDCVACGVPEWADFSNDYDELLEWLRGDS